ncbi:MAG: peptidoglycan-binding domain-containing protein [Ilumatobacter sp.]|uniref:peptidoglycan-binding domain-containing protein n=1 Tax=Ilumatobacter sp. TaxID=1967498 RepID=UPI00260CA032|nr:peptidoglycan-binding domain-containing protein [Ilumatobacter sp.]MDJ0769499.1 peptidoglycan-binding domain-containing protein [Ilumatobacter sp.]
MTSKKKAVTGAAVGAAALLSSSVAIADITGSGQWGSSPGTWQLQNPTWSNQAGFWQTLLCSNSSENGPVDGYFGPQTRDNTKRWQRDVLGNSVSAADGVVDAQTWNDTYWARAPGLGNPRRLSINANHFHSYYGGGTSTALYQNGTSSGIWKFYHGSNNDYHGATNADTIPSKPCNYGS